MAIAKLFNEVLVIKESEKTIKNVGSYAPAVALPRMQADPAKIIPIDGGNKE